MTRALATSSQNETAMLPALIAGAEEHAAWRFLEFLQSGASR
jgi:hypothetical protein